MADIRRVAEFYGAPYRPSWKWPSRPNQIPALCVASLLSGKTEEAFRSAIFDGLWHEQKDIAEPAILKDAVDRAGGDPRILDQAGDPSIHEALTKRTVEAYATACLEPQHLSGMEKFTLGRTGSKSWLGEWVALRLGHEPEIERTLGERTPRLAAVRDEQSRTSPTAIDYADIPYQLSQPFLRRADEFGIIRISA